MATRLYFHDAAWTGDGTPPSPVLTGEPVNNTALVNSAAGLSTPRQMSTTVGAGPHTQVAVATRNTTASQTTVYRVFVSPPLASAISISGNGGWNGTDKYFWNAASSETNLNVNHSPDQFYIYVFRPSTGEIVGQLGMSSYSSSASISEPTAANSIQVATSSPNTALVSPTAFTAQPGDVIVVQAGANFAQAMGTAYSASFYYGGSVVTTAEYQVVTNHASFVEFTHNFVFVAPGAVSGTGACTASASATLTSQPGFTAGVQCASTAAADLTTDPRISLVVNTTPSSSPPPSTLNGYSFAASTGSTTLLASTSRSAVGTSLDAWTESAAGVFPKAQKIAYGAGKFVAVCASTNWIRTSTDGLTWASQYIGSSTQDWDRIHWNGASFLVLGWQSGVGYFTKTSPDGSTWTAAPIPSPVAVANGVTFAAGKWIISQRYGFLQWAPGDAAWVETLIDFPAHPEASGIQDWSKPAFLDGYLYSVSTNGWAHVIRSADGVTWEYLGLLSTDRAGSIHAVNGMLIASRNNISGLPPAVWYSMDGTGWTLAEATSAPAYDSGSPSSTSASFGARTNDVLCVQGGQFTTFTVQVKNFGGFLATSSAQSSATGVLTTAKGTNLYTDGPLTVTASATATLTEGPTQWIGTMRTRSSFKGGGIYFARGEIGSPRAAGTEQSVSGPYILATGRWLASRKTSDVYGAPWHLYYSDDEGFTWKDTGRETWTARVSFASNAAGTRIVSDLGGGWTPYYSDNNGLTWTACSGTHGSSSSDIIFGNNKFVRLVDTAVDVSNVMEGRANYSTDGITWSVGPLLTNEVVPSLRDGMEAEALDRIWYDTVLGKFVAVAEINYFNYPAKVAALHSTDGITWSVRTDLDALPLLDHWTTYQYAMFGGVLTYGSQYSLDGGLTWTTNALPTGAGVGSRYLLGVPGRAIMVATELDVTRVFSTTDGASWTAHAIDGAPAIFEPEQYIFSAQDFTKTGRWVTTGYTSESTAIQITSRPVLTATGLQNLQLLGAVQALSKKVSAGLTDRVVHPLQGTASAFTGASATTLIDAEPFVVTLRSAAHFMPAPTLTTQVKLTASLRTRTKSGGSAPTEAPDFYALGNTVFAPSSGLVMTPTKRRDPVTGVWGATGLADGQVPSMLASDGANRVSAFLSTGPKTAVTTDGVSWTVGSSIPLPPAGWAGLDRLRMAGGGGRFLLYGRSGATWYTWASTDGVNWAAAQEYTSPGNIISEMFVFGASEGFFALFTDIGRLRHSIDGAAWTTWLVGQSMSSAGPHSYSAGTLSMTSSGEETTFFLDALRLVRGGGTNSSNLSAMDASVPGVYWFGDPYSSRPMFYSARTSGFDVLTDPLAPGYNHIYQIDRWAKPAGIALTGDYAVFDGSLFAKATRVVDSAVIGLTADLGPQLYSSAISMAGTGQATATATARFATLHPLDGALAAASAATAALTIRQNISGAAVAQASTTALLQVPQKFDALITAQATASADLATGIRLVATVSASASTSAPITTSIRLAATLAATSAAAATTLQVPKPLDAAGQGAATATGALTVPIFLTGAAQAQASTSGSIATAVLLQASLLVAAEAAADLTVGSLLRGAVDAQTTVSADLGTEILLASSITSAAFATAALLTQISLESALTVESISEAGLDTSIDLLAVVQATVHAYGVLRRLVPADARAMPLRATSVASVPIAHLAEQGVTHRAAADGVVTRPTNSAARHTDTETAMVSTTTTEQPIP